MDKLSNYNGSIDLISGLRPKNNGTFPLMQAHDVQVTETQRLDDMFASPESWLPVYNGASEGGAQGGSGSGVAVISLIGESGTLTDEQFTQLTTNFPSVLIKLNDVYVLKPERLLDGKYYFQMVEVDEDENGKFVGDINVIINADKTWQYGEFYIDVPEAGAGGGGNYVLELTGESGTLTDEQYQAVVDNFPNVVVKSGEYYYNGMQLTSTRYIFNVSGVVETAVGTVVTKQIQQSTIVVLRTSPQWVRVDTIVEIPSGGSSGGITKQKVTLAELVSMLTAENAGTRVDFIPKSTFRGVLPSNEALLYMTGVFPTTGIIIQIAEDAFYIASNGTAYTPALTSQFWDVSISVDSKARGIVTGATMNNGVLEANYQWNFADYVTDAYFDFYIYK